MEALMRPFRDWILDQRNGLTHAELTEAVANLSYAVLQTEKPGEITLKIKIRKASKGSRQLIVSDAIVVKAPAMARDESIFFFNADSGSLTRSDPRQPELPLATLPAAQAAPVELASAAIPVQAEPITLPTQQIQPLPLQHHSI